MPIFFPVVADDHVTTHQCYVTGGALSRADGETLMLATWPGSLIVSDGVTFIECYVDLARFNAGDPPVALWGP